MTLKPQAKSIQDHKNLNDLKTNGHNKNEKQLSPWMFFLIGYHIYKS